MKNLLSISLCRRVFTLGLTLGFLTCTAQANPTPTPLKGHLGVNVRVVNKSNSCAWVTIYWARFYTPWAIAGDPHNRPRFVHPNSFYDFGVVIPEVLPASAGEIKVRTEVTQNANCTGKTIADLSSENKSIFGDQGMGHLKHVESTLSGGHPYTLTKPH